MNTDAIDKLIEAVKLVVRFLSSDKELQKKMSAYGFTPQSLRTGTGLLNAVALSSDSREQTHQQKRHLSQQIKLDQQTARATFRGHVAIARTAFLAEPLVLTDLKVAKLVTGNWAWTKQALDFYQAAPARMARLQQFGAAPESFQQNQAAVQALLDMRAQRLHHKGSAEQVTQERNEKIKELRAWYGEFRRLARIAFKDTPQRLETFGMVVPSKPRRRKASSKTEA